MRLKQAEVVEVRADDSGAVCAVVTAHRSGLFGVQGGGCVPPAPTWAARTIVGEVLRDSGPDGLPAGAGADRTACEQLGVHPPPVQDRHAPPGQRAAAWISPKWNCRRGTETPVPFSFATDHTAGKPGGVLPHLHQRGDPRDHPGKSGPQSPLYSGVIEGVGPRYCPSIETKVVRFADKPRHQLFVEPMGLNTEELYIQGFSSSMPEEVQVQMLHTIPGLEQAEMTRCAYAIEYDCVDPTGAACPHWRRKKVPGLYGAGQFNGSSGYEEAAAQGFVAGVNAALKLLGRAPLILRPGQGYIGVLIDDLVTKGTKEPYRMMTSRTEYRLLQRQDNADQRLDSPSGAGLAWSAGRTGP